MPADSGVLAQFVAVAVLDVTADSHCIVAVRLDGKRDFEFGVAIPPVGEDFRRRDGGLVLSRAEGADAKVTIDGLRVHRAGEGDLQPAPRLGAFVAVGRVGADDARVRDGVEGPHVRLLGARLSAGPLRALGDAGPVRSGKIERLVGDETHRLHAHPLRPFGSAQGRPFAPIPRPSVGFVGVPARLDQSLVVPLKGASDDIAGVHVLQFKGGLGGGVVHRLVEGDVDDRLGADVDGVCVGVGGDDGRQDSGELPGKVVGQHAAGGIFEAGGDPRLVGGGRFKALVWGKEVDGGIEPFPLAAHWRHEGEGLRQVALVLDGGQRHDRPVEEDGDGGLGGDLGGVPGRLDGGHFQEADGGKVKQQRGLHRQAGLAAGVFLEGDGVTGGPLEARPGRLEQHGAGTGPLEIAGDGRLDSESSLHRLRVHRLVEDHLHRRVERLFLAPGRRHLDDLRWQWRERRGRDRRWRRWLGCRPAGREKRAGDDRDRDQSCKVFAEFHLYLQGTDFRTLTDDVRHSAVGYSCSVAVL